MNKEITLQDFEGNREALDALFITFESVVSLFLTGKAGAGKSSLLELIRREAGKEVVVVAPTAIAANNVAGITIHSFFQLPPHIIFKDSRKLKEIRFSDAKVAVMQAMELLVIDEVSMVSSYMLDCMDAILRRVRNIDKPFGGVQVLYIGDPWQLPPVVKKADREFVYKKYKTEYFFDSEVFKEARPYKIELKKSYRQKDDSFTSILDEIRVKGKYLSAIATLNDMCYYNKQNACSQFEGVEITTRNDIAENINKSYLEKLDTEEFSFDAIIEGNFTDDCIADRKLILKVGAKVMLIKNEEKKKYINGTMGTVAGVSKDSVQVLLEDNQTVDVKREAWEQYEHKLDDRGHLTSVVVASLRQFPIRLAWAITVHKSQGLTFERMYFNTSNIFAAGQLYVAISRCRRIEGLTLSQPLKYDVLVSKEVAKFYKSINDSVECSRLDRLLRMIERKVEMLQGCDI